MELLEFIMLLAVFIFTFGLGWFSGCIHVYNQEIKILNGFRKRIEDIEAKHYSELENLENKHEEN